MPRRTRIGRMDERKASNQSNGLSTVRALVDVVDRVMEPIDARCWSLRDD